MKKWNRHANFFLGVCLVALALLFYAIFIEPGMLLVNTHDLRVPHWSSRLNGLKIVVLSDLHVGSLHIGLDKLHKVVSESNAQKPDLILLLGDYVTGHGGNCSIKPPKFQAELSNLKAKYGVYSVLGNHDWWYNGTEVKKTLESAGMTVLENSSTAININDQTLWIAGLEDLWTRKPDIKAALSSVPDGEPVLLLMHSPDLFPAVPSKVALSLAGHTHGGQVSLPFIGPLVVPSRQKSRFARGVIIEGDKNYFVSSGIGTSIFPIRFCVPPEISVLKLSTQ